MNLDKLKIGQFQGKKVPKGVFLSTSEEMIEDQKEWCDEDEAKNIDFSLSKYWMTTDDGQEPIGFDTLEEITEFLFLRA